MTAIACAACGRRQDLEGPKALTLEECRIIGWAKEEGRGVKETWLCPLHAPGGVAKLEEVAKKGLGER
ncbi:MAG TPA: hypothetical protein VFA98_06545 [Thermoanaerobaculia bacterium]|jgi:hypothetical protein|nr:hypothetical protein [Thermoanaerobaculia bacterium]